MAITINALSRIFKYNGTKLKDPSPSMTPDAVRRFYAKTYPELTTALVDGPVTDHKGQVFEFRRAVGTKG